MNENNPTEKHNGDSITWAEQSVKLESLRPYERNPRKISAEAFAKLKSSLQESGYHQRILCQPDLRVIGGHQRIKALQELGINEIVVLVPSRPLTQDEYRRILIQDNIAFGQFDIDMLKMDFEMQEMEEWGLPPETFKAADIKKVQFNAAIKDTSEFVLLVEFTTESEQQMFFAEMKTRGISCKIIT